LNQSEQETLANAMGATLVKTLKEYKDREHSRRFGRELWRPLLWALLALVFFELILQQWFARRKIVGTKIPVGVSASTRPAEVEKP
jgi:hypothetical protein